MYDDLVAMVFASHTLRGLFNPKSDCPLPADQTAVAATWELDSCHESRVKRRSMVAYLGSYKKSRQKNLSPDSRSVEMLEHHVRAGNRV
jgi:hypothetical protein